MAKTPTGTYAFSATARVGIFVKRAGTWTRVAVRAVNVNAQYSDGAPKTAIWTIDEDFQLGNSIQMFGVRLMSVSGYNNTSGTVEDLVSVTWQASTSATISATPDQQETTVTVRPQ